MASQKKKFSNGSEFEKYLVIQDKLFGFDFDKFNSLLFDDDKKLKAKGFFNPNRSLEKASRLFLMTDLGL